MASFSGLRYIIVFFESRHQHVEKKFEQHGGQPLAIAPRN